MWIPLWKAKRENKVKDEADSNQDDKRQRNLRCQVRDVEPLRILDPDKGNFVKYYEMFRYRGHTCIVMEMLKTTAEKQRNSKTTHHIKNTARGNLNKCSPGDEPKLSKSNGMNPTVEINLSNLKVV